MKIIRLLIASVLLALSINAQAWWTSPSLDPSTPIYYRDVHVDIYKKYPVDRDDDPSIWVGRFRFQQDSPEFGFRGGAFCISNIDIHQISGGGFILETRNGNDSNKSWYYVPYPENGEKQWCFNNKYSLRMNVYRTTNEGSISACRPVSFEVEQGSTWITKQLINPKASQIEGEKEICKEPFCADKGFDTTYREPCPTYF